MSLEESACADRAYLILIVQHQHVELMIGKP